MRYLILFFILFAAIAEAQVCDFETPRVPRTVDPPIYTLPKFPPAPTTTTPTAPPPVGDRIIAWMHGLGGNNGSWETASAAVISNWKINSQLPEYNEFAIETAATTLQNGQLSILINNAMEDENTQDYSSNFIIAHSQGGLVSRAIDRLYTDSPLFDESDRKFGGIVTFGTPHGGAYILNSSMDGSIEDFADNACNALLAGPAEELYEGNWLTAMTGIDETIEGYIETQLGRVCGLASEVLIPNFLSDYSVPITEDYYVGAPYLNQLDASNSTIPKVAFYGEETEPVMWRTFASLRSTINGFAPFTADADQALVDVIDDNTEEYEMKYLAYEALGEHYENSGCNDWQWIVCPPCCLGGMEAFMDWLDQDFAGGQGDADEAFDRADDFYDGWQWWLNANDQWKTLIGAREYVPYNTCHCVDYATSGYILDSGEVPWSSIAQCASTPSWDDCWTVTHYTVNEEKSDGIVPVSSAIAFPGAVANANTKLAGSNHQQMRNDSKLLVKLTALFGGGYHDYFFIEPH